MKIFKLFASFILVLAIIYWTKLSGNKFRSTIEFQAATSFVENSEMVLELFGDLATLNYVRGESLTDKSREWSIYQFNVEGSLSEKVIIWVSDDKNCKGVVVRAEFHVSAMHVYKTKTECIDVVD